MFEYGSLAPGLAASSSSSSSAIVADSLISSKSFEFELDPVGMGGGGLEVFIAVVARMGGDGLRVCVSGGPGPGILTLADGAACRVSGMSTAREWAFSAGESTSALPAAFRMNVYTQMSTMPEEHHLENATDLWIFVIDASQRPGMQQELI